MVFSLLLLPVLGTPPKRKNDVSCQLATVPARLCACAPSSQSSPFSPRILGKARRSRRRSPQRRRCRRCSPRRGRRRSRARRAAAGAGLDASPRGRMGRSQIKFANAPQVERRRGPSALQGLPTAEKAVQEPMGGRGASWRWLLTRRLKPRGLFWACAPPAVPQSEITTEPSFLRPEKGRM